jgi:hypothetical protein
MMATKISNIEKTRCTAAFAGIPKGRIGTSAVFMIYSVTAPAARGG